jgi:hypothetical protein
MSMLTSIASVTDAQWETLGLRGTKVFTFTKIDSTFYAGTDAGLLFSTDNGIKWVSSKGLAGKAVYSFVHFGKNFFAGTDSEGIYISNDSALDWSHLQGMSNSFLISSLLVIDSNLYASTIGGGIFRSADSGQIWSSTNNGLKNTNIYSFAKFDKTLFAGSDAGRVYLSNDMGANWVISDSGENSLNFIPIVNAFTKKDTLLFSTRSQLSGGSSVFVSTDRGGSWSRYGNFGFEYDELSALLGTDSGLFVGCFPTYYHSHSRLFRCIDNGVTWVNADDRYGGGTECLTLFNGDIYAGTTDGLWRRRLSDFNVYSGQINVPDLYFDNIRIGDTECKTLVIHNIGNDPFTLLSFTIDTVDKWQEDFSIDTSQFPAQIKAGDSLLIKICFHPHTVAFDYPQVIWNTDITPELKGNGKYYSVLYGTGVLNADVSIIKNPYSISLYPNPTTGIIIVHNAPSNMLHVTIANVLGETVSEIANPDIADFTIDLSKLPPGTYFAKFSGEGEVITRKIIRE